MMDDMQEDVLRHLSGFSLSRLVNLLLDAGIKSLGKSLAVSLNMTLAFLYILCYNFDAQRVSRLAILLS